MNQILTKELVDVTIDKTISQIREYGEEYKAGIRDVEECFNLMYDAFTNGFFGLLQGNSLYIEISEFNYEQFSNEYYVYKKGELSERTNHHAWLYVKSGVASEATLQDQRQVFYLMKNYHLLPEFFSPIPNNIVRPNKIYLHGWHKVNGYGIHYYCIDDGGLLLDPNPIGKTFRLRNDIGNEAVLTVKEDRRFEQTEKHFDFDEDILCFLGHKADFLAEGYIEGYTAKERKENPDVLIRIQNGKVFWLSYLEDTSDLEAYYEYPLWQDYLQACKDLWEKKKKILSEFFYYCTHHSK